MKSVLITGASTGIGAATALHLDSLGMQVFAGVRDTVDGDMLAAQASHRFHPVELEVTDDTSVARAADLVSEAVGDTGLWAVVNNAGEAYPGPLEIIDLPDVRQQLEVNLVGQIRVTQAFLPLLRAAQGRIVFVGSIGGKLAFEFAGPYHASKFAIEAISDVWRQELHPDGIAVSVVEPGPMSTPIWGKAIARVDEMLADPSPAADRYRDRLEKFRESLADGDRQGGSPESVAKIIEKALTADRPATRYPVGLPARVASVVTPFVPDRLFDLVARRIGG